MIGQAFPFAVDKKELGVDPSFRTAAFDEEGFSVFAFVKDLAVVVAIGVRHQCFRIVVHRYGSFRVARDDEVYFIALVLNELYVLQSVLFCIYLVGRRGEEVGGIGEVADEGYCCHVLFAPLNLRVGRRWIGFASATCEQGGRQ